MTDIDNPHREKAIKEQIEELARSVVSIRERAEICNISNGDSRGNLFDDINGYHVTLNFLNSDGVRPFLKPMQRYIISRLTSHYRDATDQFNQCQCKG